jgi:indole-3-glycerol phosphate synthase
MTYLDELLALRARDVARKLAVRPLASLREAALERTDYRPFAAALRAVRHTGPAIIAEFKRASPSAGAISPAADPAATAAAYEGGGAAAISVVTEPDRFCGSFDDLRAARAAVALPVLCKDFIVDDYQVWEAAAEGADAVLLIVAALGLDRLRRAIGLARELGLAALVEVHDEAEGAAAIAAGADVIGINNRDLRSFAVDIATAPRVRSSLPAGIFTVAESGYATWEDVSTCGTGIDAILVGEALMRAADVDAVLRALRGTHP